MRHSIWILEGITEMTFNNNSAGFFPACWKIISNVAKFNHWNWREKKEEKQNKKNQQERERENNKKNQKSASRERRKKRKKEKGDQK